ncbi:hypothetical protein ACLKA7_016187 [Drosophila subpalustris]
MEWNHPKLVLDLDLDPVAEHSNDYALTPAVAVSHWGGLGQHQKRQQQREQREQQRCPNSNSNNNNNSQEANAV